MFRAAGTKHAVGAAVVASVVSIAAVGLTGMNELKGWIAVMVIAASAALVGTLLAVWFNRKLGGLTGDTYGAMNEAAEAACLVALCVLCKIWTL
jgi:cobalamin synthase